ncbi:hypothetical protein [Sulfurimonas sp.]|jgi:hypothetical protein|uniref:hypothetical protein n=1 Tax=Sulfurimonas sp. TaxID=2022749 RepID=UPI0025CCCCD4|nr:hypothetical protein [Sulfurimonas sp.]MBT5935081.1 hypothetical protein [Sulfurimonas sp.]
MKIEKEIKIKNIKLNNYKQFDDAVKMSQAERMEMKIQEAADYVEYIKVNDKEAYRNYLSYSTYLKL